jgi:hypothetical protein
MPQQYDRRAEDLGNIVGLEHVNVQVADQGLTTLFYISGLGLTRDPYLMTGIDNMWVNVGKSQFHLITGKPQVLRGRTGLVVQDLKALVERLERVKKPLAGTKFEFREGNDHVDAVCPWGNRLRLHAPDPKLGPYDLGMPYIEFDVPAGSATGIAKFYDQVFAAPARVEDKLARVVVGNGQELRFRETDAAPAPYDRHHIQIYVANFSGPHRKLLDRGLITEESNQHQYRFEKIVDLDTGKELFVVEHEVRSMTNPLYARPLVNRNPAQTNRNYAPGRDAYIPAEHGVAIYN